MYTCPKSYMSIWFLTDEIEETFCDFEINEQTIIGRFGMLKSTFYQILLINGIIKPLYSFLAQDESMWM
jgi:hypothetical protein